jgi:hypothetical protein
MGFHDRTINRESHAHAASFGGEEGGELVNQPRRDLRSAARAVVGPEVHFHIRIPEGLRGGFGNHLDGERSAATKSPHTVMAASGA